MFASGQAVTSPEDLWPGLHRTAPNAMPSTPPRSRRPYQHKALPRQPSRRGRGRGGHLGAAGGGLQLAGLGGGQHGHVEASSGLWPGREWIRPLTSSDHGLDASRARLLALPGHKGSGQSDKCTQMPDPEPPNVSYASNILVAGGGGAGSGRLTYCQKRAYKQLPNETEEQRLARLAANRERARLRRANETLDERQRRLADNRERARTRRAQESEEARFIRLADGRARGRSRWMNETEEQRRQRLALFREKARVRRVDDTASKSLDMHHASTDHQQHQQEQQLLQQLQQAGVVGANSGRPARAPRGRRRVQRAAATSTSTGSTARTDNGLQQEFVGHEQQQQQQQQQPMNSGDQEIRLVEQLLAPGNATGTVATVAAAGSMSSVAYPPNGHTGPFYSSRSDHVNAPCSACYPLEPFIKFNQGKQLLCEGHSRLSQGLQLRHQEFI